MTGVEIERGAYGEHQGDTDLADVLGAPALLLGAAQADPQEVGFRQFDHTLVHEFLVVLDLGTAPRDPFPPPFTQRSKAGTDGRIVSI